MSKESVVIARGSQSVDANGIEANLVERWAGEIRQVWAKGTNDVLELAKVVCDAHDVLLPYRGWTWLIESGQLPFKKSQAKYLVFIGKRLVGTLDGHVCGHLPHQIGALYELARLHPGEINRCVAEGLIRGEMNRTDARVLVARLKGAPSRKPKVQSRILRRLDGLVQWIIDNGAELNEEVLQQARERAVRVLEIVGEELNRSIVRSTGNIV